MTQFHVLGGELIPKSRFIEQAVQLDELVSGESITLPSARTVGFDDVVNTDSSLAPRFTPIGESTQTGLFTSVGLNKPLAILISHIYTGKYPRAGLFGGSKDLAVVTGVKDYAVFAASSRAINFLKQNVESRSSITSSAFEAGTPLVSYQSAVVTDSQTITIECAFDNFPEQLVDKVGDALLAAAGIPLFLPWAGYLMTASAVTKLAGGLADALFDGKPAFSFDETLDFNIPGRELPTADFRVLASANFNPTGLRFDPKRGLVDATGKPYQGDEPYAVISLDGAERPKLEGFAPTVASAAVLKRFFNMRDGGDASVEAVLDGLKLLSDSKYRLEADALKKRLSNLPDGDAQRKGMEERYKALVKNITDDRLKPAA
ncbi:hypothetical protein AB4Z01_05625 [Inquilinus sp. YAF38]|uniref:hypothetical protein n=1 Tax=Inquilinus sp. YAF38 TaxID=3233084 RepID=UPI003F90A7D2